MRIKGEPIEAVNARYEKMDKKAQKSYFGKILKKEIDKITNLQAGKNAPDFHLVGLNGEKKSLKDFAGQYVLIYHWGLCPGSLSIDREVIALHNKYKDHLQVVGITDKISDIKNLYENIHPEANVMGVQMKPTLGNMLAHPWFDAEKIADNAKIEEDYAFGGFPYFVFISPDGKIIERGFFSSLLFDKRKTDDRILGIARVQYKFFDFYTELRLFTYFCRNFLK